MFTITHFLSLSASLNIFHVTLDYSMNYIVFPRSRCMCTMTCPYNTLYKISFVTRFEHMCHSSSDICVCHSSCDICVCHSSLDSCVCHSFCDICICHSSLDSCVCHSSWDICNRRRFLNTTNSYSSQIKHCILFSNKKYLFTHTTHMSEIIIVSIAYTFY